MATEYAIIIRPVTRQQHEPSPNVMLHSQFKYRNKNDEIKNKKKPKVIIARIALTANENEEIWEAVTVLCVCVYVNICDFSQLKGDEVHTADGMKKTIKWKNK